MAKFVKGEFTIVPSKAARRGLPPKLQVIYMWLSDYSDADGECFPSRKTLAADCGISIRALDAGLIELESLGLIEKSHRINDGEYTSNFYHVNILIGSAKSAPGGAKKDTTPSAKSAHRTQPNINSNHLTHIGGDTAVSKKYYQVVKKYGLPVRNHNNLRQKIKEMEGIPKSENFLDFLLQYDYDSIEVDFKPELNEALDIYAKMNQIINQIKRQQSKKPESVSV